MAAPTVANTGIRADLVAWNEARPIDRAYREIDALGGWFDPESREAVAEKRLLNKVLAILESHGAVDPTLAPTRPAVSQAAA